MPSASASQRSVTDYFTSTTGYWKSIYSDDSLLPVIYRERHDTVLRWIEELKLSRGSRILEIGCGAGLMTISLARRGYTVDAVDSTPAMLETTRKEAVQQRVQDQVRLHPADVHALPFDANTFDLVIAIGVIPWLHSERLALQEMQRVLRRYGHLLVTADNDARLNRLLDPLSSPVLTPFRVITKRLLRACGLWRPPSGFQPRRHHPHAFNGIVRDCGLEHIKSCTVGFGPFTFLGKALLGDSVAVRLHQRLQALTAGSSGGSSLRWRGSHYLLHATKR